MPYAKINLFSEKTVALSEFAKALSHPARIEILTFLHGRRSCTCGDIVAHIPLSQPSVSRHLATLKDAGLVTEQPRGSENLYSLENTKIQQFCDAFSQTLKPQSL
jgi:DNA-binding transcriptional ArsR family regulator